MNKKNDFNNIGKRMPYTTPECFFDDFEEHVMALVQTPKNEPATMATSVSKPKHRQQFVLAAHTKWILGLAASIIVLLVLDISLFGHRSVTINDVDQAFSELSTADQDYLLDVYQDEEMMLMTDYE